VWAAVIALIGVAITGLIQLWIGRRTVAAAHKSAEAAKTQADNTRLQAENARRAAEAADRSATAAAEAVGVNRETALGVAQRAVADALAKRYQDAAEQIGHDKAAVRLAGIYAMTRLADDWPEQRQQCIDVLCAYYRMSTSNPSDTAHSHGEREIQKAILNEILARVGGPPFGPRVHHLWSDCVFDFTGARFENLAWAGLTFRGSITFAGASFAGHCEFLNCDFDYAGASFQGSLVTGTLRFRDITSLECGVNLREVTVPRNSELSIATSWAGRDSLWWFDDAEISGLLTVYLSADTHRGAFYFRGEDRPRSLRPTGR
jgi:hypothetical protein